MENEVRSSDQGRTSRDETHGERGVGKDVYPRPEQEAKFGITTHLFSLLPPVIVSSLTVHADSPVCM